MFRRHFSPFCRRLRVFVPSRRYFWVFWRRIRGSAELEEISVEIHRAVERREVFVEHRGGLEAGKYFVLAAVVDLDGSAERVQQVGEGAFGDELGRFPIRSGMTVRAGMTVRVGMTV